MTLPFFERKLDVVLRVWEERTPEKQGRACFPDFSFHLDLISDLVSGVGKIHLKPGFLRFLRNSKRLTGLQEEIFEFPFHY